MATFLRSQAEAIIAADFFEAVTLARAKLYVLAVTRMNSIMERWIQSCRHELLDRSLTWNQTHLLRALREYEQFHNEHRPHRGLTNVRPLHPLPEPITGPEMITHLRIQRRDRLGGVLHEYEHTA